MDRRYTAIADEYLFTRCRVLKSAFFLDVDASRQQDAISASLTHYRLPRTAFLGVASMPGRPSPRIQVMPKIETEMTPAANAFVRSLIELIQSLTEQSQKFTERHKSEADNAPALHASDRSSRGPDG